MSTAQERALRFAEALIDHRGSDVRVLDLRELTSFTDFLVLATGTSDRHVRSLGDKVAEIARDGGQRPFGVEGEQTARWIAIDLGDVVVHVFQREARAFYNLDKLWGEASAIELPERTRDAAGGVA